MSLVRKISPVGIDTTIDSIQASIYDYLVNTAGWVDYESYPRVYKNSANGNVIPEHYTDENEYIEVLLDDKFNVTSFFLVDDKASSNGQEVFNQTISIIFQGILPNLYPTITHRADAEMHDDIFKAFSTIDEEINQISTGVDNVYADLSLRAALKEKINQTDMSDLHVVKLDFDVNYVYNCRYDKL